MSAQTRPLGTAGKVLSINDLHLIGKILNFQADPVTLAEEGYTPAEVERSNHLFETLDAHLTAYFGNDWDEKEVL